MTDQTIEPCPFCGGECRIFTIYRTRRFCVGCKNDRCWSSSKEESSEREAIAAHNRVSLAAQMFNTMCKSDADSRERFFKAKSDLDAMGWGEDD